MRLREQYRTVSHYARVETEERKSRFIATCSPLDSEAQAIALLSGIRNEFPDATHHVYAWIIGGEQVISRFSDDGEPQGTAGLPVLDILRKSGIESAGLVVTRYFGGTLLGSGGLVRAYSQAAALALEAAEPVTLQLCQRFNLTVSYSDLETMRHRLTQAGYYQEAPRFGLDAEIIIGAPRARVDELLTLCNDVTAGAALVEPVDPAYIPLLPG